MIKYEHHNNDCLNTILRRYSMKQKEQTKADKKLDFILKNQRFYQ